MNNSTYVLIMAGGIGSRFWPVSRTDYPKQFLDILGTGSTLIQQTWRRFEGLVPMENIFVVTAEEYIDLVKEQLPLMPRQNIIGEPERKNTAACIAYMSFKLAQLDPNARLLVAPSDQLILQESVFHQVCRLGFDYIDQHSALVTLGIKPTYPATGFGYIQMDELKLADSVYSVKRFVEKPYLGLANSFMKREDFFWNAGIFIWKVSEILTAFKTHLPELYRLFDESKDSLNTPAERDAIAYIYYHCESISIDFGILEKSDNVVMIPAYFDWSDLGSWTSAWRSMNKDESGNATAGKNIIMIESRNCMVQASANKLLLVQGLDDFIIVDTSDVLLISHKEKEQEIKTYLTDVKQRTGAQFLYSANYYTEKEESRIF